MQLLIVGAGASYAEARERGLPEDLCPPLMKNFAARMWSDYNPHYLLSAYLAEFGHDPGRDARATFIRLESEGQVNVERFFEFAFRHSALVLPGNERFSPASEHDNLLYHGILNPLVFLLVEGLFKGGVESASLPLAGSVARRLHAGDTVVNLNYDTIFEIAAEQAGLHLTFLPNKPTLGTISVCKPHGSMNLLAHSRRFYFARPLFAGSVQPADGSRNYVALVPPRLNKSYLQHPIAQMILEAVKDIRPAHVTFWGVGMTESDADLLDLYREWCLGAAIVDFINPSSEDVDKARKLLGVQGTQFVCVADWQSAR